MDFSIWQHTKETIINLCPLISSTVNWKRRVSDNGTPNPYVQTFIRAAISLIVASVIGIASGTLSAYIMINTMNVKIDGVTSRVEHLENRFNNLTDDYYRRNTH